MKTLVIAEKPSAARDIASALGQLKKNGDCYEDGRYIVSSAVGHLAELYMPEDFDKNLRYWRLESLPIIPDKFRLKPIERSKGRFNLLKKLLHRKDIGEVINACDAGREGELIFTYLYELASCKKPVKRLWMQSMTPVGIRQAFGRLRDGSELLPLQNAARCRSEADWLIGINGTRAVTTRLYGHNKRGTPATVGRVQTPTLSLVLKREKEIENFQPRPYWRIEGRFAVKAGAYKGLYQKKTRSGDERLKSHDRSDRLWERAGAERVLEEIRSAAKAEVSDKKKRARQAPPRLYDLTTLQREANNRFGLPANATLRAAQALYEKHKMITYPRTDSRALPEDYLPVAEGVLGALTGDLESHARKVLEQKWLRPSKRVFNNAQISDHFAIIPTEATQGKLSANEAKIYGMVARRFIAVFYPPAEFDVTTRLSAVTGHEFKTEGKVQVKPGWLEVYGKQTGDMALPALSPEDGAPPQAKVLSFDLQEDATKPPSRYSEATLLTAMESAGKQVEDDELAEAMKEKGLGTPATRAQIIEHLLKLKYLERRKRELVPTAKTEGLVTFLEAVKAGALTSPALTGEWEYRLNQMEKGQLSRGEFMRGIEEMAKDIVHKTKAFEEDQTETRETGIISPTDSKPLVETLRGYQSRDGKLRVNKIIGNRKFSESEVKELVERGETGPFDDFRSRYGKPFAARVRLAGGSRVELVFENQTETSEEQTPEDLSECPVAGKCPKDGADVLITAAAYICRNAAAGRKTCNFRVNRSLLGKTIPEEQFKLLLEKGRTGLIGGFRSKKTKKLFSAYLALKKDGGLNFEFPPRPAKKKTAKKTEGETPG